MSCPAGYTFESTAPIPKGKYTHLTESLKPGDHVSTWWREVTWTEDHIPSSGLEPFRFRGDPLADRALEALKIKPTQNALEVIGTYLSKPENEQESDAPRLLVEEMMKVPEWLDWAKVRRGQEATWRYLFFVGYIYLHCSFVSGYAYPRMAKVLTSTGYLNGPKTQQRVFETSQFVFEAIDSIANLQPGTGTLWKSILQIRLLHTSVRARLTHISRTHSKFYNTQDHGVPINQEDMMGTLVALSSVVWVTLEEKFQIRMEEQEKEDMLHLWRYIGYLMGVEEQALESYVSSPAKADAMFSSLMMHISDPDETSGKLIQSVCQGLATPPVGALGWVVKPALQIGLIPDLFRLHMALSERVLGQEFWQLAKLSSASLYYRGILELMLASIRVDLWMVRRMGWWRDYIRTPLVRQLTIFLLYWNLGVKRCEFEMRELPKGDQEEDDFGRGGRNAGIGNVLSRMKGSSFVQDVWPQLLPMAIVVTLGATLVMWTIA